MTPDRTTTVLEIVPTSGDVNADGLVDGPAYLRWVQTVVVAHWERLAPERALKTTLWIALRHRVKYVTPSRIAERLTASTRIRRLGGIRAEFSTIVERRGSVVAEIDSTWVCLDAKTRKPKSIEPEVRGAFGL